MKTGFFRWSALLIVVAGNPGSQAPAADDMTDAKALLRGVEAAREEVEFGHLQIEIDQTFRDFPKRGSSRSRVEIVFSGSQKLFIQTDQILWTKPDLTAAQQQRLLGDYDPQEFLQQNLAEWREEEVRTLIADGNLVQFNRDFGAHYRDPTRVSQFVFDPRVLGLSAYLGGTFSVQDALLIDKAAVVSLVGSEQIDGREVWQVLIEPANVPQQIRFWIQPTAGFRVSKYEIIDGDYRALVHSDYGTADTQLLPESVRIEEFDASPKPKRVVQIKIVDSDMQQRPPNDGFTLNALEMPLGQDIIDDRVERVIGYWDGTDISDTFPTIEVRTSQNMAEESAARQRRISWLAVNIFVVIGLGALVGWRWYQTRTAR